MTPAGPGDLGRALADVHRTTAAAFGWHRDNMLGRLPQHNAEDDDWPAFFADRRLWPYLDAPGLPAAVRDRLERAIAGPLGELLGHDPAPSLVHGDLWPGNLVDARWLIDPAVHHADREYELAVMQTFGGAPRGVLEAYGAAWPLPDGWQRRRPAYQLPIMLAHVKMFGSGYVGSVVGLLDDLGW